MPVKKAVQANLNMNKTTLEKCVARLMRWAIVDVAAEAEGIA